MKISARRTEGGFLVSLSGDILSLNIDKLRRCVSECGDAKEIWFDVSALDYADSSLLNFLVETNKRFPEKKIVLSRPNEYIKSLLGTSGMQHIIEIR